jgi:hypothetical protein
MKDLEVTHTKLYRENFLCYSVFCKNLSSAISFVMRIVTWNVFIVPDLADRHVVCQQTVTALLPEFFHRCIHELRHLDFLKAQIAVRLVWRVKPQT